jgi:hypothetical protein
MNPGMRCKSYYWTYSSGQRFRLPFALGGFQGDVSGDGKTLAGERFRTTISASLEGIMSRDIRPRRRQEDSDHFASHEAGNTPAPTHGSDASESWRDAWHVSPSRRRHDMPDETTKKAAPFRETLFDIHPNEDQDPERWDGLS